MNGALNFDTINQAALAAFPAVLNRLLPGGENHLARAYRAQSAPGGSQARLVQDQSLQWQVGGLRYRR